MKNKIKKINEARVEGDYSEAQRIIDEVDAVFQNEVIDLNKATAVINNKLSTHGRRKESENVTRLLTNLHNDNFFQVAPNTGFTANSAIEKAIDFNNKIIYTPQGVNTFASYTDVVGAYEQLQKLKNQGGHLYLFDTETIGGKNTSNIWNPLGITEYASQKINMATGEYTKTNIVLGIQDTIDNKQKVEKILNALGSTLNDKEVSSKLTNDASIILNDEELRVTAYRLAIYGDYDSKFEDVVDANGRRYKQAKSLASSDIKDWLDPEKIKRGWQKNVEAFHASPMTEYGLNEAQLAFIDSVAEMYYAANSGTGMIGGQNIVPFDFKVVNTELARYKEMLQKSIDTAGANGVPVVNAKKGLAYIESKFGKKGALSAPSQQIFDTLPMIQFIREKFGINALFNNNQEAIAAAGKGTAKQENIGAVWFPDLFASGEAHMADFDVDVQRAFFTAPIPELGDKTFIEHFMTVEQGGGLKGLNMPAQTIKAGNEQQILYAKKGTRDRTFGGKAALDHTYNRRTGEVFTSSNYEIMGPNKMPQFAGDINMGTHINKGHFYYVDDIKKIKAADLADNLGATLPELSGPDVYQVRMRMAVADKYKGRGLEDLEYVLHFGSEYELSGWFSSNFDMPLVKDENGKYVLNGDNALDILEKVKIKDGEVIRSYGNYLGDPGQIVQEVLELSNEKALVDSTLRDLSDPNKMYSRIEKQLKIRAKLTDAGLDNVTQEEIADLLFGTPIARMEGMTDKQSKSLIKEIQDIAGFVPKGSDESKVYSNSIRKTITAWDFIGANDEFYMKTFDNLEKFAEKRNYTMKQRNYMFAQVVENLKAQVANEMFEDPEKVKQIIHNVKDFEGSLEEVKKIYDIALPDTFIKERTKKKQIESGLSINNDKNILTVRLGDKSSSHRLEDQLVKMKYGENSNLRMNPEHYKRIAMYDFVKHLNTLDDFKDNEYIQDALKHMNANIENFNSNTVAMNVLNAMEQVKAVDPTKGIIKDINVRSVLEQTPEFNARLNSLVDSVFIDTMENTPVPLDLTAGNTDDIIRNHIKNNVLHNYLPTRAEFDKTLTGLNKTQRWQKELLYDTLEKQITDSLVDITGALSQVPNSEFMIMPDGRFIFKQGQQAITIDSIPKIKLDGDTLYGQVGNSKVQVHLDLGLDAANNMIVTTNLGEAYTKNKTVTKNIKRRVKDGTFIMEDVYGITSHLSEKFRQDSRYEFKSGDWFSNFMVGTGELQTLLPKMFSEDGDLNFKAIADKINLTDKERQILADAFKNVDKTVEAGELDPVINQYLSAYWVEIVQGLSDARGDANTRKLSSGLTIGTKGKGKLQHGKLMGSNMRFATGFANSLDNLGRPVVDGSGNVKFIRSDQVREAAKRAQGLFYDGALFESVSTDPLNKKIANGVGEITTGWTSRTAYVGQHGIKAIIENNQDRVLANNTIKNLADEKKQNIYNMMKAYVNTFEQQKVLDARTFDSVNNVAVSANTIKLSTAKDFVNIPKEEKLLHADKYERLLNLMGDIEMTPEGVINYKSSVGDIVKPGETIIPFAKYGGESTNWTTKMDRSLLRFQVYNQQGIALTDEEISEVLRKNKHVFDNVDINKRSDKLGAFLKALDDYEVNFTVEDVNRTTLPKILANDSEKSMNHILYAKTGTINEQVAQVFKSYSDETAELVTGTVLTDQALAAYFKDIPKRDTMVSKAGFSSWDDFVSAWKSEMYTMSDVLFGKGGIFEGFTDIANDNLLGHDNKGTMLVGSLNEAVAMLGKYSSADKQESQASLELGFKKFLDFYNKETIDDKGNKTYANKFFINQSGEALDIELVNGRLRLKGGQGLENGLDKYDMVDYEKLESMIRDVDKFLVDEGATKEDRLIHKVKQVTKDNRHVFYADDEGEELFGRMLYSKEGDKDIIVGSIGSTYKKIVMDPETQSSMPQEYFDTKMDYLKLKGEKTNIEHELNALRKDLGVTSSAEIDPSTVDPSDIEEVNKINKLIKLESEYAQAEMKLSDMDEYLKNMEGTGHAFRIGDQEEKIIKNYFVNADRFGAIDKRIAAGELSEESIKASNVLRGIDRNNYTTTEGVKVYQGLLDELHAQKYYNEYFDTKELIKSSVKKGGEYEHLKYIYDDVIGTKRADKLGVETAELMHQINMAKLADEYNNVNRDKQKLIDAGFEIMTPEKYLNDFGDPNAPGYTSAIKKNVLLELDMMDGSGPEYIAVSGMGSVLDNAEIRQDWHKHAGKVSKIYQTEFLEAHGDPNKVPKILERMEQAKQDLRKSTSSFLEKGSEAHKRMRQEVHAATDRVKIISTMGDPDNPLLQQAQIEGRSISEWIKDGVYHDYTFDSLESFEKRGYFKKDFLESMGMNSREEMIEHLRVHGTVMMDDRYPNIRERSLTPIRHYLAVDDQGMNFLANNATMMAPWTMLAMNADSDGDSVSRFLVKHKNVDHLQYSIARNKALEVLGQDDGFKALDALEQEKQIKAQTIGFMKSFGIKEKGLAAEAYDTFFLREVEMGLTARDENKEWYGDVVDTWKGDSKKTVTAMSIKYGDGYSGAEVVGGKSVFGKTRFTALSETPTWKEVRNNMDQINQAISVVQSNAHLLSTETQEYAKDILEQSADIFGHNDENKALDQLLTAYGELAGNSQSRVSSEGFASVSEAAIKRSRINKYHIEGMKKLGVTATGNVNSTLYGISQAIKSHHGDINNPMYDEIMRSITSEMSYLLEETPISGKKHEVKAGDARLIEFGEVFRKIRDEGRTDENIAAMKNYFSTYMNHDEIARAYDMTVMKANVPVSERLTEKADKVNEMIDKYTDFIGQALDKDSYLYSEVQGHSLVGRKNSQGGTVHKLGGKVETGYSNLGDFIADTSGINTQTNPIPKKQAEETAEAIAQKTAQEFKLPEIDVNERRVVEGAEAASNKIAKSILGGGGTGLRKSLGLGVVGLAAGLIAAGYASGNPLNDPDPATVTQEGFENVKMAPEMMFSSGQGFAPNNTGGYIINIKGDTRKGNRQLKKALKQATRNAVGPTGVTMNIRTSQSQGAYSDKDIENILNNYF
jgi:hypothetical protein